MNKKKYDGEDWKSFMISYDARMAELDLLFREYTMEMARINRYSKNRQKQFYPDGYVRKDSEEKSDIEIINK